MIQGLVGIFSNDVVKVTPKYIFSFDTTVWGWIHLILGLVLILIGLALVAGKGFARVLGIIVVAISAISNSVASRTIPSGRP